MKKRIILLALAALSVLPLNAKDKRQVASLIEVIGLVRPVENRIIQLRH